MQHRAWRGVLAVFAGLGAVAAGLADPVGEEGALAREPQTVAPVPRPFTHAAHLNLTLGRANSKEVWRDCRGCHGYPGDSSLDEANGHTPQQTCHRCHNPQGVEPANTLEGTAFPTGPAGLVVLEESFQDSLAAMEAYYAVPGFAHTDHLDLACTRCHTIEDMSSSPWTGEQGEEALLASARDGQLQFAIPVGAGMCVECHDDGSAEMGDLDLVHGIEAEPTRADWTTGPSTFFTRIDEDFAQLQQEGAPARFDHRDHMLAANLVEPEAYSLSDLRLSLEETNPAPGAVDCTTCHGSLFDATGPNGEPPALSVHHAELQEQSCSECHVADSARESAVRFVSQTESVPSRSFLTFAHSDHLRSQWEGDLATSEAYQDIESEGCMACHVWTESAIEGQPTMRTPTFDLRQDRYAGGDDWSYRGCMECHDVPAFLSSDGAARDRAPEDAWGHLENGVGPGWENCQKCHGFGSSPMSEDRREVTVERIRPGAFQVLSQAHPAITGDDLGLESCAQCHKADLDSLPSRIGSRRFTHESHVPEWGSVDLEQIESTCTECHNSRIADSASSADIGTLLNGREFDSEQQRDLYEGLTYDPAACSRCHRGVGEFLVHVPLDPPAEPSTVFDFPHDIHMFEPNGSQRSWPPSSSSKMLCTTCHFDTSGSDDPLTGNEDLGVLPTAMDCTMCHQHGESSGTSNLMAGVSIQQATDITGKAGRAAVQSCESCHSIVVPKPEQTELLVQRVLVTGREGAQVHPSDTFGQDCSNCHLDQPARPVLPSQDLGFLTSLGLQPRDDGQQFAFLGTPGREAKRNGRPGDSDVHDRRRPSDCMDCHWESQPGGAGSALNPLSDANRYPRGNEAQRRTGAAGYPFPGFGDFPN